MTAPASSARWLWICLALAFVIRAGFVASTDPSKVVTRWSNVGDATLYDRFGWNLAQEGVLGVGDRPSGFVMPGYPLFLSGIYSVVGHLPGAVRWAQVLLGVAAVAAIGSLGRRVGGRTAGVHAALFAACYPFLIYFVPELLTETLFIAALLGMIVTASRLAQEPRILGGLLHGLCFATALMTRSVIVVLAPATLLLAEPWKREGRKKRLTGLLLGYLVVSACWAAWITRNYRVFDQLVPFDTHGGFTLYTSQLIARGVPHDEVIRRAKEEIGYYRGDIESGTLPGGPAGELEADRRAAARAREIAREDPGSLLRLLPHNVLSLWLNFDFKVVGRTGSRLSVVGVIGALAYAPILILGFVGLARLWRDHRTTFVAFSWILLATTALFALTHGGKRYRVASIDPILIALAGAETGRLVDRFRDQRGRSTVDRSGGGSSH